MPLLRVEEVGGGSGTSPGQREKSQPCFPDKASPGQQNLPKQGWWGLGSGARSSSRLAAPPSPNPQPSNTFQRLFMRYFLSKIWDLRRRLQRLAFSARLLSQGWARHWAALMRALWGGGSMARVGDMPMRHQSPAGLQAQFPPCLHMHALGSHTQGSHPTVNLTPGP